MAGESLSWQAGRSTDCVLTFRQCVLASFTVCSNSVSSFAIEMARWRHCTVPWVCHAMILWPSDDLQDLPFLSPTYRKAQKWERKNLIRFVLSFLILWKSGLSLPFLLDPMENLHEDIHVLSPFPTVLRKPNRAQSITLPALSASPFRS